MNNQYSRKRLPPYISYRTFRNFIIRLQQQIPARIDRSYWGDMLSGSTGIQLMAALRFLELIDANGKPSGRLRTLVPSKGEQQTLLLREITTEAYDFVLHGSLDLQNATYGQLEEAFHSTFQLTPDVCRKCIKFFISIATEARVPLSPFMIKKFRSVHTDTGISTTKKVNRKRGYKAIKNGLIPQSLDVVPEELLPWNVMLLAKFPVFDPNWNDEVKLKWFSAFDELLKHNPQRQDDA